MNDYTVELGPSKTKLMVSNEYGMYIDEAKNLVSGTEFKEGTPIIDLTGQSPGILHALGAANIGQAWTIGGYKGSEKLAVSALQKVSCEQLVKSWLLVEPKGPRSLPYRVIDTVLKLDVIKDYKAVAAWSTAIGSGGYNEARIQKLMKPMKPKKLMYQYCEKLRS